jgi:amino acid adenylation domain-containing protein
MTLVADIRRTAAARAAGRRLGPLPLTPTEERYVLAERLTPHVYTIPRLTRIDGPLEPARFAAALDALLRRHPALRTGFAFAADGRPSKYIVPEPAAGLELIDLPGADLEAINDRLRPILMAKPDFSPASLGRYHLVRVSPSLHFFSFSNHHSISDGQSARLALAELLALYEGRALPPPGPPPHEIFGPDWARTEPYPGQLAYWLKALDGAPAQAALPADIARADGPEMRAIDRRLAPQTAAALARLAAALGVSEFTVAYAVTLVLLTRLTGEADVLTAFQSNGRRAFPQAAGSIGGFSNALVLRAPISPDAAFADFAQDLARRIREATANELPPYHHIIAKTGVHPCFGVNWFPAPPVIEARGLRLSDASHDLRESDYQLNFRFLRGGAEDPASRRLVTYYRARELSASRIEELVAQYEALARAFAAEPARAIGAVRLADLRPLPPSTAEPADPEAPITAAFLARARAQPEHPALEAEGALLSYGALAARAGGVAALLDESGVPAGAPVAILARRNAALVVQLLGVSLSGRPFLLLDSGYPDARLAAMIAIARPAALVVGQGDDPDGRAPGLAGGRPLLVADPAREAPPALVDPATGAAAYMLFTSGTTGEPKGVAVGHRPLAHFARWQAGRFGIGPDDRVSLLSGLAHDPLLRDIFTTLSAGATLLVPTQAELLAPGGLARWVGSARPTRCHLTPALGELMLAGATSASLASVRSFFWGGDMLRPALVARFRALVPTAEHVNFYGATETPQAAAHHLLDGDEAPRRAVPIGRATPGYTVDVMAPDGGPAAAFEPGEVVVGSELLVLGTLHEGAIRPPATPGRPMGRYATGDLGFPLPDGAIQLVGRADDQVKIRGHRVEPADIANCLRRHPMVVDAAVLAVGGESQARLVAFSVDSIADADRTAELAAHVARSLPAHMVPAGFVGVQALPLLPNGKLDRARLLQALDAATEARAPAASRFAATAEELQLIEAWQRVLGRDGITPDDSLVSLGGDSLSFVNLYLATEDALGAVPDGWQVMSVRDLARSTAKAGRWWRPVDTSMLTRAIAIFLVVSAHLKLIPYLAGATTALFLVTGYLFGGLQLPTAFRLKSERPLVRMMANLIIPVLLFSIALYVGKLLSGKSPHISILTMTGNFFDYRLPGYQGRAFYLWYVHCAIQILLIIFFAFVLTLRFAPGATPRAFAGTLFAVGVVARFLPPALLVPDFWREGVPLLSMWSYLPTTHLPTVMLGVLVALADTPGQRRLLTPVTIAYGLAQLAFFPGWGGAYVIFFGLLLLHVRRVPLPRFLSAVLLPISGASLFIYLTHFQLFGALSRLGLGGVPLLTVLAALLGGILLWKLYSRLAAAVTRRITAYIAPDPAEAEAPAAPF